MVRGTTVRTHKRRQNDMAVVGWRIGPAQLHQSMDSERRLSDTSLVQAQASDLGGWDSFR